MDPEEDGYSPNSQKASKTCVSALLRMLATLARHAGVPGIGNVRMVEEDGEGLILLLGLSTVVFASGVNRAYLKRCGVKHARAINLMLV